MEGAIGSLLVVIAVLVMLPLVAFAGCKDTQTPITVPAASFQSVDGFGRLAIPDQGLAPWVEGAGGWRGRPAGQQVERITLTRVTAGPWQVSEF